MSSNTIPEFFCPECKSSFKAKQACFPFCSERCKLIDLGAWAQEKYRIPLSESKSGLDLNQGIELDSEQVKESRDEGEYQE